MKTYTLEELYDLFAYEETNDIGDGTFLGTATKRNTDGYLVTIEIPCKIILVSKDKYCFEFCDEGHRECQYGLEEIVSWYVYDGVWTKGISYEDIEYEEISSYDEMFEG